MTATTTLTSTSTPSAVHLAAWMSRAALGSRWCRTKQRIHGPDRPRRLHQHQHGAKTVAAANPVRPGWPPI